MTDREEPLVVCDPVRLRAARAGDPAAIAQVVEQLLAPLPLVCLAERDSSSLRLDLICARRLNRSALRRQLLQLLGRLRPQGLEQLRVSLREASDAPLLWQTHHTLPEAWLRTTRKRMDKRRARREAKARTKLSEKKGDLPPTTSSAPHAQPIPRPRTARSRLPPLALLALALTLLPTDFDLEPPPSIPTQQARPSHSDDLVPRTGDSLAPRPGQLAPPMPVAQTLTIRAVGDVLPASDYGHARVLDTADLDLLDGLRRLLGRADLIFGNLETSLTREPRSRKRVGGRVYAFRTPPHFAGWLRSAGFDALSVSNNHALDFGPRGHADTLHHLNTSGIANVGARDRPTLVWRRGLRLALLGFTHTPGQHSVLDQQAAEQLVRQYANQADLILVSIHAGAEGASAQRVGLRNEHFAGQSRGNPMRFARAMVDAGADLVLGHGPHVLRGMELYHGRLIAYSLGNFIGYGGLSSRGPNGLSLLLEARLARNGRFIEGRLESLRLSRDGLPASDPRGRSLELVRYLTRQPPLTDSLRIESDGRLTPRAPLTAMDPQRRPDSS